MKAEDILNNTDREEIRNILYRLRNQVVAIQSPPVMTIIQSAPAQYPAQQTDIINNLDWFNVKDYGAVGDGVANDTTAINNAIAALNTATRGVLYFPAGAYKCTAALTTITADALIMGDGTGSFDETTYGSKVICTSGTAVLFTVTSLHAKFLHLELSNSASTPSAGAGIQVSGSSYLQRVDFTNIRVYGFYINIDVQVGTNWIMDSCILQAPVKYGVKIQNTVNGEHGEWWLVNSHIFAGLYNADAAIRIESSGGGHIINTEINMNWGIDSHSFNHGIDINSSISGYFIIGQCLIQNLRGNGINAAGSVAYLTIHAVQFGLSHYVSNTTGNCINISGPDGVSITGCTFIGGTSPAAISLTNVAGVRIAGNVNGTFSSLVDSLSGCTDVVISEPTNSVTGEITYGLSSAVGTSIYFARADHTHGSPALAAVTPQPVAATGSAGIGSTPSKWDHEHKGVSSVNGEYGDVIVGVSAGQVTEMARWASGGGTTFDLPDIAEYLLNVFDNGSLVDPLTYSLSSDRTQIIFDSSITAGHVVVADFIMAQV